MFFAVNAVASGAVDFGVVAVSDVACFAATEILLKLQLKFHI